MCTLADLVCLTGESHWECCKNTVTASDCRQVCQSTVEILNI